ncbi:DUF4344 domain-containing metallopeptidase [Jannaschia ovalis]|uniref:DUF4344 domain-containing metallopeptidase n=1 Tax=Jannaschia ovalis TaxID=3038773 RepID=A0ABY8LFJ8_9RHOB|nr:DUF4344 domain-containing metallopeptidase [Jannaschia sp. GRR-S6-38]WGH80080.1 DUF4344 domain-containing metallopeptidase [Jannaschia sp. GRR-S6-38]
MTLYHELGHAVIDQLELPVYGVEETAADVFALVLAERLHPEDELTEIMGDMIALMRVEAATELFDHWAQYMPAGQRLARAICLFYGAAPGLRGDQARAWGMPPAKAERCRSDGRDMRAAWGPVLDGLRPPSGRLADSLRFDAGEKRLGRLRSDMKRVNRALDLPRPVPVVVEPCGEPNAFYFGDSERIVFCTEYLDELAGVPLH